MYMEVTATQFRRDLFRLMDKATQGEPVYVTHRSRRFRITPEEPNLRSLDALSSMQIVNSEAPDLDDPAWKEEMVREWEEDWAGL
jgi:prevent-host-death family protein